MRTTKWIIGGFAATVVLLVCAMIVGLRLAPSRDPNTHYGVIGGTIKSFDPAVADDTLASAIAGDIFESLYNYQYGVQPYQLMPELAEGMPRISDKGLTYTIKLRKGIHFYDPDHVVFPDGIGPEVTAEDVIYSWKRVANFYTASPLYTQIFQGRVDGLDNWFDYTQKCADEKAINWDLPVAGLTALDHYTLRIQLTAPYPQFISTLAYMPTAVVCRKVVDYYGRQDVSRHPVGTGPYCMRAADYREEQRVVLTANPIYRGRPDIDGNTPIAAADKLPHIKRIQFDYFLEELPIWLLFQQGLLDADSPPKETFHEAINAAGTLTPEMIRKGIILQKADSPSTMYIGFKWNDPIVGGKANAPLRQAMSMALDRYTFIQRLRNGRGTPAIGPIPPGFPTFDPKQVNPYTQLDLKGAREKIAEEEKILGHKIPPLTMFMGGTDASTKDEGEFIQQQMQNIGITLNMEYRDWARYQDLVDHRQAQIFAYGWDADYPDEQDFFQLFYGKNADPGDVNSTGYVNPEFDKLYQKASAMDRSPERDRLYKQMSDIIMEDCPWLLEFYPKDFDLYYDWMGNVKEMQYGYAMIQYETLDSALRQKRLAGKL